MKKNTKIIAGLAVMTVMISSSAMAAGRAEVSPFTDNISVHLSSNMPTLSIGYQSDNDVNISGPSTVTEGTPKFPVRIFSDNELENGYTSMTLSVAGSQCQFEFIDGPYTYLAYRSDNPPVCQHLSVSQIQQDAQYQYHIDVHYKK